MSIYVNSSEYPEYCWVDTAFGGVHNRNNVMNVSGICLPAPPTDCFSTIYRFQEDFKDHVESTGSVKGSESFSCYTDSLWFDIDSDDLTQAYSVTRDLILRGRDEYCVNPEYLRIHFSGKKGFHVGFPAELFGWEPSVELPRIVKAVAITVGSGIAIDTSIYDRMRILRLPGSLHGDSGLYKVRLDPELFQYKVDVNLIVDRAKSNRQFESDTLDKLEPSPELQKIYKTARKQILDEEKPKKTPKTTNTTKKPCIDALLKGVKEGQRNEAAIRLADFYKKEGKDEGAILEELKAWNEKNQPAMSDSDLATVAKSASTGNYDYGCNDPLLKSLCQDKCRLRTSEGSAASQQPSLCDALSALPSVSLNSLRESYATVKKAVLDNFDERVWFMTECCLAVVGTMVLSDIRNPVGLNLVDVPSSSKTTVLSFFDPSASESAVVKALMYKTDDFTPRSFVSHAANIAQEELEKVDLLPRIKHKAMILPELAPIFGKREDDLKQTIGVLTRVFDGTGYETDTGARGKRGYSGDYFFTWLGATTPLDQKAWRVMAKLGSRMLFLTLPEQPNEEDELERLAKQATSSNSYSSKVCDCGNAVHNFLEKFLKCMSGVRGFRYNRDTKNDVQLAKKIALLAMLVSQARSYVAIWKENDGYEYKRPSQEKPDRLTEILCNLARGHALISGRQQLTEDDLRVVQEVALSSMPDDRRMVIEMLLNSPEGTVDTAEIASGLSVTRPTAMKIMETLTILGVCDKTDGSGNIAASISLKPRFRPLLNEEFRKLRFGHSDDESAA